MLKEKWKEEFKNQCVNNGNPNPFRARERSMGKKIIVVIDHYVPTFDKDSWFQDNVPVPENVPEKGICC